MTPVLEVTDLHVGFGPVEVVHGISLAVDRGAKLGIVGESGSGKSVTALSIMRLLRGSHVTGEIRLGADSLLSMSRRQLDKVRGRRVAMIYQDPMSSLNPVHTIGAQLRESLRLHTSLRGSAAADRAAQLLDEVGIAKARERLAAFPYELSGGMRQRVMIALGLCGNPELLIADEPTTALDMTTQARIIDLLDSIVQERRTSVVLITHDLGVAAGFCDDIIVMRDGTLVERGTAPEIYGAPDHPYTRGLLGSVIDLRTDIDRPIPTISDVESSVSRAARPRPSARSTESRDNPDSLLCVTRISKTYRIGSERLAAVSNVSFDIKRGETFGLVGESGSGKSTTARCVLNLTKLDAGSVVFDGIDLKGLNLRAMRKLRCRMQIVLQDPFSALNRRLTVERIIAAPLHALGIDDRKERSRRVGEILELVGLDSSFRKRFPREMSGGQCQRVAVARALVMRPDFLVLDESVSSLDVSIRAQVLNLLRDLQLELGLTYLFVSHDLGVIRYMCNEIAVMKAGQIVEAATRDELFANPRHEYTRLLLEAIPVADPAIERARRSARVVTK